MKRTYLVLSFSALLLIPTCIRAQAQDVDCTTIRQQVAQYGKIKAYAWALTHGYSPREIARIRKQCGV